MPEYDMKFKDFSLGDPGAEGNELGLGDPITFAVGKDQFAALPVVAPILLSELVASSHGFAELKGDVPAQLERVAKLFDLLLTDETAPRFRERILSRKEPLDLNRQVLPIMHWLMECYGMRPTEPSSSSTPGVNDGGPGSTDGAPNAASALSGSPPPVS